MDFDVTTMLGFHTVISLVALLAGIVVILGMVASLRLPEVTLVFLATAVLTSATGFLLPADRWLPSHVIGLVSLLALGLAVLGRYGFGFAGAWRVIYVLAIVLTTYLDAFVAVVQAFLTFPVLQALAPTQTEPPFAVAQGVVLAIFLGLAALALRRFDPSPY